MATYNGAEYVEEQLRSILEQLGPSDEVIVVDDQSTDGSADVVRRIGDPRIVLHVNDHNRREVFSFGRAMSLAKGDVVFLADQDDVWMSGRVESMKRRLVEGSEVVASNFEWMDAEGRPIDVTYDGVLARDSRRHLKNIVDIFRGRTNYYGCAMAFRRSLLPVISPIPRFVESHDLWIALAGNVVGGMAHLDQPTLYKRKHGNNATSTVSSRPMYQRLWSRMIFAASLAVLLYRRRRR
jgi:glycosyltransferase involved in cell wall biosynthesis